MNNELKNIMGELTNVDIFSVKKPIYRYKDNIKTQ